MENLEGGQYYRHFKGNQYLILAIINNNVIYLNESKPNDIWIRPCEMFNGIHESGVKRFEAAGYGKIDVGIEGIKLAKHTESGELFAVDFDNGLIGKIEFR